MFTQYFGLKFNPFTKEIPADKLFISQDLLEMESRLQYLQKTRGIGLVVGEPGSGKSTALRKYVSELNPGLYKDSQNPFILILAGQPLIRSKLTLNINNPLRQRLVVKYIMQGLKLEEVKEYCSITINNFQHLVIAIIGLSV